MNNQMREPIDKSTWGEGPWQAEPDRAEWEHAGLPCLAIRNRSGVWCGYAAVPPGHPSHGQDYNDVPVEVHGGLTYGSLCDGHICHVPKPGDPDDVYWFGFDCHHGGDFGPGMHARTRHYGGAFSDVDYDHASAVATREAHPDRWDVDVYRTLDYVQGETNRLAEQLAALALSDSAPAVREDVDISIVPLREEESS